VSRCGNDFVVFPEREAITELQSGGQASHTPLFFLFLFFFFLGALACAGSEHGSRKEKKNGKRRSDVQDHAALDVHDAVWRKGSPRRRRRKQEEGHQACRTTDGRGKERRMKRKKEGKEEDDGAMKRAGRQRGDEACRITKRRRGIKKVVPSWILRGARVCRIRKRMKKKKKKGRSGVQDHDTLS